MEGLVKSSSNPSHGQLVLLDRARPFFFFIAFSLSRMKFPRHPQLLWSGVKGGGRKEGGRGTDVQSPIDACYFQEQKMDLPILSRIWFCSARNGAERVRNTTYRQYCGVDDQLGRLSSE